MAGAFFHCFTHSNISTSTQLTEKLKEIPEGLSDVAAFGSQPCLSSVQASGVKECVVMESYIALVFFDGRVCRVRYQEEPPAPASTSAAATAKDKSDDEVASTSSARSLGSRSVSPQRVEVDERVSSSAAMHALGSLFGPGGGAGVSRLAGRNRIQLLRHGRHGAGRAIFTRWPVVPTADVPDQLVDQAMAVLQGKSREAVIRELQRTHLDVNQAVNNLLSRDEDDGEHDEGVLSFIPATGEELLSLLGSGLGSVGDEELEEALGRSDIRSLVSLGDGVAGGRIGGGASGALGPDSARQRKKRRKESNGASVMFHTDVEWWPVEKSGQHFSHITGLYTELLAVDNDGRLRSWPWSSPAPLPAPYPLEAELGLSHERVKMISGRLLRVTVVTESGKLATWLDRSVANVSSPVEHRASSYSEMGGESVLQLHTSELFSVVLTDAGRLYWWGHLPFAERKLAIVQAQEKIRLAKYTNSAGTLRGAEIGQGNRVCLRSSPVYTVGARAIHVKGGQLQCGVLQENVFLSSLSENCRFRVLPPSLLPLPPHHAMEVEEEREREREGEPVEELVVSLGSKRKRSDSGAGEEEVEKEEFWSLRDVLFVGGLGSVRTGTVVKVDGSYAAVHFSSVDEELKDVLTNCRLLRKDELVLASDVLTQHSPYLTQEPVKRLRMSSTYQPLAVGCDARGVHLLLHARSIVRYVLYNLHTGKFGQHAPFGEVVSRYLVRQGCPLQLLPISMSLWLLVDGHGGLYPLCKDSMGSMKDPPLLNLPPVRCVGVGACSSRSSLVLFSFGHQVLLPAVLHREPPSIWSNITLTLKGGKATLPDLLSEHVSGHCNVLHLLAGMGRPRDPPSSHSDKRGTVSARTTPRSGMLREIMKQAVALASGFPAPLPSSIDTPWGEEDAEEGGPEVPGMGEAVSWLDYLTSLHGENRPVLAALMAERNMEGYTPFMAAVATKAYSVALKLFDFACSLSRKGDEGGVAPMAGELLDVPLPAPHEASLLAMLYPPDSHPDDNPVFLLCRNDTCSFTWTGEEHVHQDIFECRTCGLIGTLCCCTECAYTCHRGHDCGFKKASPTAYCDCWERCKCRALAPGATGARQSLLLRLLKQTPLGSKVNARGEHLLGALLTTVARQSREQSAWHGLRSASSYRQRPKQEDMPAHDLAPPTFAPKALSIVLEDWPCTEAAVMGGATAVPGEHSQTSTLDNLTHTLLAKHSQETLDSLLTALVKHMGPRRENEAAVRVTQRFLRSVVRVFTVCGMEVANVPSSGLPGSRKKSSSSVGERADRVFLSLPSLAIKQLVSMATSLIYPVTMGVSRPVDPLCMSDRHRTADELFSLPPPSLHRVPGEEGESSPQGDAAASDTESEAGDGDESTSGGPAHDASSTATVGSNPLYLSDQESSDGEDLDSVPEEGSLDGDLRPEDDLLIDHAPSQPAHLSASHSHWALPTSQPYSHPRASSRLGRTAPSGRRESLSMAKSSALLAQTFSLLVHRVAQVMERAWALIDAPTPPYVLPVLDSDPAHLLAWVWAELEPVWVWLVRNMDQLEHQVEMGNAMQRRGVAKEAGRRSQSDAPSSELLESRRELFSYLLTLMRSAHAEHAGLLPAIDVAAQEHLAWVLDALFYLLQTTRPSLAPTEVEGEAMDVGPSTPSAGPFFRRSSSTLCLGVPPVSPFAPLAEGLPLAERPHLLEPEQPKRLLFLSDGEASLKCWPDCSLPPPAIVTLLRPRAGAGDEPAAALSLSDDQVCGLTCHHVAASVLLGRWACSVELFGRVFADSVGKRKKSFLAEQRPFESKEREFRREMEAIRTSAHREMTLESVLSDEPLPRLEPLPSARKPLSPGGLKGKGKERLKGSKNSQKLPGENSVEPPLFYQPGKPGFYSPCWGPPSPERLNGYRNVGRVIGLCLLNGEVLPLPLCRPVVKCLLKKEVSWHDLAFFDPLLYESLRKLVLESRGEGAGHLASLGLSFSVSLSPEDGGGCHALIADGADVTVTPDNIYTYVQKYAELRMVTAHQDALKHLQEGVYDVIPEHTLTRLSAEDLRLLLCGCPQISVDVLRSITIFDDESRKGADVLLRFKSWFWAVVERMSQKERQELLYFWTSSPTLPASVDSYQPPPSLTIRPADDFRLPTANTCISRIYIPLYSSKSLLRSKLLTAIRTRTFGFV